MMDWSVVVGVAFGLRGKGGADGFATGTLTPTRPCLQLRYAFTQGVVDDLVQERGEGIHEVDVNHCPHTPDIVRADSGLDGVACVDEGLRATRNGNPELVGFHHQ